MFSVVAKALPLNGPAPRARWFYPFKIISGAPIVK